MVDKHVVSVDSPPTPRRLRLICILAFVLACIIGRLSILRFDNSPDGEMFILMGKLVAEGKTPGIDVLDVKSPSVGILMSLPWRVLGANWLSWGMLSLVLAAAASAVLIKTAVSLAGPASRPVALVTAVAFLTFAPFVHSFFQLEHVLVLTSAIAGLGAAGMIDRSRRRSAFLLGVAAGTGLLLKPTSLGVVLAALATLYLAAPLPRRRLVQLPLLVGGGLFVPLTLFAMYLTLAGEWTVFADSQRAIAAYQAHSTRSLADVSTRGLELLCLVLLPILLAALVSRREARATALHGRLVTFAALWFAIDLALALLQGRTYPYYFLPLAAPATLLAAALIRGGSPLVLIATLTPLLCLNVMSILNPVDLARDRPRVEIADSLLELSRPGDAVWMNDWPRLAVMSDRKIVSAVPHYRMMVIDDAAPIRLGERLLGDLRIARPRWIVVPWTSEERFAWKSPELIAHPLRRERFDSFLDELDHEISARYTMERASKGWAIFKRNDDAE